MKRIAALLLSAALAAGVLSGCGREEDSYVPTGDALYEEGETVPPETPPQKTQITVPYYADRSMNPYRCTDHGNRALLDLIYQGLFALDEDYQSWAVLCESYQVSWDMKTYTFSLANATFSDGSALKASDVTASLKAAKSSDVYRGRFTYVTDISSTEDNKVVIQLEVPCENFPALLDVPIVKSGETGNDHPIGTGPYVFTDAEIPTLQRRTDWWCTAAVPVTVEKITLLEAGTTDQLRDAFEFSDLSLVSTDPSKADYADFHSDYELWESENGIFLYLGCRKDSKVLAKSEVRQALARAIDRESIVDRFYHGFATAAILPASPHSPYYSIPLAGEYGYDPSILAGMYQLPETEDTEQPQKEPPQITLLVNGDDSVRVKVAQFIAEDLTACGLKVKVVEKSGEGYQTALTGDGYDLYLGQTRLSPNMDLSAFFKKEGTLSVGGMDDQVLYALCKDSLANIGNYYNLHQKIMEDGQLCPILFQSYAVYTQRGSFYGLTPSRDHLFFYHLGNTAEDVRVEE